MPDSFCYTPASDSIVSQLYSNRNFKKSPLDCPICHQKEVNFLRSIWIPSAIGLPTYLWHIPFICGLNLLICFIPNILGKLHVTEVYATTQETLCLLTQLAVPTIWVSLTFSWKKQKIRLWRLQHIGIYLPQKKKKKKNPEGSGWRTLLQQIKAIRTDISRNSVQSLSHVQLFETPWTAARQASYPSPTPGTCWNWCPLSRWCHPAISSSVDPFSSHLQSFPASGSFPLSQFFTSGGQSIGVSASTSVLPMNIQDWFPLGWTGWISLQSKGLSKSLLQHHSSKASILRQSAFFIVQLSHPYMTTGKTIVLTR